MEFLDTYKRLDNLCKDIFSSSAGITSYIAEMDRCRGYSYKILDWESDYQKLKHYRIIRNQIVHENWASESSLCDVNDVHWLNEFYERIMHQTDPLAQYHQLVNSTTQQNVNRKKEENVAAPIPTPTPTYIPVANKISSENKHIYVWLGIIVILVSIVIFAVLECYR